MFELVKEIKKDIRKQLSTNKVNAERVLKIKPLSIVVPLMLLSIIWTIFYKMINKPNEWEQSIIDNAVEYSVMMWRPLDKSTKTIVKTYDEAKDLYKKTIKKHRATLVYAINKAGRYANKNHLDDFKKREDYE